MVKWCFIFRKGTKRGHPNSILRQPLVFHKQTGTLLYSLFVSWSFYWQSNGRVDGFTMCTLSDAYVKKDFTDKLTIKKHESWELENQKSHHQ